MERAFVWAGGGLFVSSLALAVWMYAVWFGDARPSVGWAPLALDAFLLSCFALHHSVCARAPIKRRLASVIPERLLRSVYVWIASLLLVALCLLWRPIGGELYRASGWRAWPFGFVQLAGVWLIARAVGAIDALELAGIRKPKVTDEELQDGGVYGIVRHPIYFGWVLGTFGAAHMTGDRLAWAVLTTAYLIIAMPWEEQSLERAFGRRYVDYKRRVRWKILPYVY